MKTIRIMAAAALVIATGLALYAAQPLGIKHADLLQKDLSVPGREIVQVRVDFAPGWRLASIVLPSTSLSMLC